MNIYSQYEGGTTELLKSAYEMLKNGRFSDAGDILENALSVDFDNPEVICALKCAGFWTERENRYNSISDPYERGEYLMKQWKAFLSFLDRDEASFEQGKYSLKQWVFSKALSDFIVLLDGPAGSDPEILFRVGQCYKGKGNYRQALEYLEACNHQKADDPRIIAELADCYAFINETQAAKIFFREAFFIDPQRIDLDSLESMMIVRLVAKLKELGYEVPALSEWIPVYGVLYGVFNVKRELRSLEYGRLKQSIFTLQSKLAEEGKKGFEIEPRLINRYFWLIDHYLSSGDSREKIDEVLQKIHAINPAIHERYTQ
ncbi:MAG: tetratricopeptide repeat protein [Spirochaetales bacterium]|nr:tetratricopeptide repeat protein [Spirochaetales bacterium]